jgi:hypothetical protein
VVDLSARLKKGGIENGPEMDDPPQQYEPEDRGQTKLDDRHEQSALEQLPQPWNKETAERGKNIARGTLSSHASDHMSGLQVDKAISRRVGRASQPKPEVTRVDNEKRE